MARLQSNTRIYGTANVDTSIGIGGNVVVNTGTLFIGNSTINTIANSTVINTASHTTGATGTGTGGLIANVTTLFIGNNTINTFISTAGLTINNNANFYFRTVNASATVSMRQQNDDNFVFYSTNTAYGARAIWSVFANSITSNLSISVPTNFGANAILTTLLIANGGSGTAGQVLASNGSTGSPYWATVTGVSSSFSASSSGYVTLAGGIILQWGKTASISIGGNATVTFPIAFPNACWSVISGLEVASGTNSFGISHAAPNTTAVVLYSDGAVAGPHTWYAIGN
jgi:hypothetical protein